MKNAFMALVGGFVFFGMTTIAYRFVPDSKGQKADGAPSRTVSRAKSFVDTYYGAKRQTLRELKERLRAINQEREELEEKVKSVDNELRNRTRILSMIQGLENLDPKSEDMNEIIEFAGFLTSESLSKRSRYLRAKVARAGGQNSIFVPAAALLEENESGELDVGHTGLKTLARTVAAVEDRWTLEGIRFHGGSIEDVLAENIVKGMGGVIPYADIQADSDFASLNNDEAVIEIKFGRPSVDRKADARR